MKLLLNNLTHGLSRSRSGLAAMVFLFLLPGDLGMVASSKAQSSDEGVEILTRGPVHEAFAATNSFKTEPAITVAKAPPAVVDELPPEQRPDGANVTWIPGYWSWDDEAGEFIWVSGIWRNLPPGRQWIPGYWSESAQEYQWVPGYWADETAEDVEYLDEPPASLEAGPNLKAPSKNHSWVPGNWRWQDSRYSWQGGYWDETRPNWTWVPPYYTSTPRGYIYVDGYYDYDAERRGVIFAPVRFSGNQYGRPDYRYRPSTVISLSAVINHLFLRPRSRHYYFGDYYAPEYRDSGYYASRNYYSGGHGYDPIYAHQRWTHRGDDGWERRSEENYTFYRDNRDERPPHTLAAFTNFFSRPDRNRRVEQGFASRLDQVVGRNDGKLKFRTVDANEREDFIRHGRELREYSEERRRSAVRRDRVADGNRPAKDDKDGDDPRKGESKKVKTPKSPVVARGKGRDSTDTPPERAKTPRSDELSGRREATDKRSDKNRDRSKDEEKDGKQKPGLEQRESGMSRGPKEEKDRESGQDQKGNAKSEAKKGSKGEPKSGAREESDPNRGRGRDGESKDDAKGESRQGGSAEPDRGPNKERKGESKEGQKPGPRIEPKKTQGTDQKREIRQDKKGGSGQETKREERAEPRRELPRKESKGDDKREPKAEPRRREPKQQPKEESKPEPKRAQPQEPRRQSKAEPEQQAKTPSADKAPAKKKSSDADDEKEGKKKGK